jgi:hypothetical protein
MSTLGNLTPSQLSGSGAPYCSGPAFLDYCDIRPYADLLSDTGYRLGAGGGSQPDPNIIINSPRFIRLLTSASGEVEAACLKGQMYLPVDLATLVTYASGTVNNVSAGTTITAIQTVLPFAMAIGQGVSLSGIVGATQANGPFVVTGVLSNNSFTILTATTSPYVSGGVFQATTLPNSGETLQRIVAGVAVGYLWERRPDKPPESIIGWALQKLEDLKNGVEVFGLLNQQEAGIPSHHVDTRQNYAMRNGLVWTAKRGYFGNRVIFRGSQNAGGANPAGNED